MVWVWQISTDRCRSDASRMAPIWDPFREARHHCGHRLIAILAGGRGGVFGLRGIGAWRLGRVSAVLAHAAQHGRTVGPTSRRWQAWNAGCQYSRPSQHGENVATVSDPGPEDGGFGVKVRAGNNPKKAASLAHPALSKRQSRFRILCRHMREIGPRHSLLCEGLAILNTPVARDLLLGGR